MTEKVRLKVDNLWLAAEVRFPEGRGPYPSLCICHGIPAKSAPDPADGGYPLLAERFRRQGFAVLIFNFRGAGESEGNLDMMGWTRDLAAAIDYLYNLSEVDSSRISVMGFSGGAASSVYRAARDKRVSSLITCACPAHFHDITGFGRIDNLLAQCRDVGTIRDKDFPPSIEEWAEGFAEISPIRWIQEIFPRPLLIIHGDSDQTVDPGHAWELYVKAKEPREICIIAGAGHRLRLNENAMDAALSWLKKVNGMTEEN